MYDAFEASGKQRIKLAKKPLTLSEDCADAYVLLAEESARSLPEMRDLYAAGVEAGKRSLGEEMFAEAEGHFWGVVETRPYMRTRAGLANCLWQLGQHQAAIEHYEEMQRLNPGKKARAQLQEALHYNPHVSAYLLGRKRLPKHRQPPVRIGPGAGAVGGLRPAGRSVRGPAETPLQTF